MVLNLEFKELLINLQSQDNEIRNQAELTYESIESTTRFELLLQFISSADEDYTNRIFSGVLCRRLLDNSYDDSFKSLPEQSQNLTKQKLLEWIANDSQPQIRKKLSEIAVEIAQEQFDENGNLQWRELLSFIFEGCLNSGDTNLKAIGLQMFAALPNLLGDQLLANIDNVCLTFARTMGRLDDVTGCEQPMEVRVAAVKAYAAFIRLQIDDGGGDSANCLPAQMGNLISTMLHVTADSIAVNPDDDQCMKTLVDITDVSVDFLKPRIPEILELCTNILHNNDVDESQKHLAIEVFVSLTENCPGAVRKCSDHFQGFIQILFKMLTDLEDDPEWATMDTEDEEDDSSPSIIAEMSLDRIACAMRGRKVLHEITRTVPAMLHSSQWQERHGGLMAISSCAEGLNKVMEEILGSIIDEIVPLLADPHPRVRYAACNAVGQLSTDFGHKLQKSYHAKIVPALLAVLDDDQLPRVQAYAGAAMVNFCEDAPKSVILHYLPVLTDKLLFVLQNKYDDLLRSGRKLVLEQIVTTIAAVADSVGDHFGPYYDGFMEFLKFLMRQCDGAPQLRLLQGKTIECISLMGLAVGRDRFMRDAQEVMQLLLMKEVGVDAGNGDDQQQPHEQDQEPQPQQSYMISAWARICKLLGKSFAEFLPLVMQSVLRAASIKPDVCMMYNEEADDVDRDWQVVKIADDQNFAIHTSGLEDKATACQMLVCYARELSDAFSPYVLPVADIMIPLLKFYFNEEVRSSAAHIMPLLIDCARPLGSNIIGPLWQRIITALLAAIPLEPYKAQIADMLDAIADGVKKVGPAAINEPQMEALVTIMEAQLQLLFQGEDERSVRRCSEEYDEEDDEEQLQLDKDEDDDVLCRLVDLMHALFLVYGQGALPVFDRLLPLIGRLQEGGTGGDSGVQYCVCFWADMIEGVGAVSWRYCQQFLPLMVSGLRSPRREVRQGAIYGFGLMAMCGGPEFAPVLAEVAPVLEELTGHCGTSMATNPSSGSQSDNSDLWNMSRENAVSALTKICKYRPECVPGGDLDAFLQRWLDWLPIWEDREETPHVYGFLCDLAESGHCAVNNVDRLPAIVRAIAVCVTKEGLPVDGEVFSRCVALVRMVQANSNCFTACLNSLSKEEQSALQRALEQTEISSTCRQ